MFTKLSKFRIFICSFLIITFIIGIIYLLGGLFFVIKEKQKSINYLGARLNILMEYGTGIQVRNQGNLLITTKELDSICQIYANIPGSQELCKEDLKNLQIVTCNDFTKELKEKFSYKEEISIKIDIDIIKNICTKYKLDANIERKNIIAYGNKELLLYNTFYRYDDNMATLFYRINDVINGFILVFLGTFIFWFLVEGILFILNNKIDFVIRSKK